MKTLPMAVPMSFPLRRSGTKLTCRSVSQFWGIGSFAPGTQFLTLENLVLSREFHKYIL